MKASHLQNSQICHMQRLSSYFIKMMASFGLYHKTYVSDENNIRHMQHVF
jgi:hypothetical protein